MTLNAASLPATSLPADRLAVYRDPITHLNCQCLVNPWHANDFWARFRKPHPITQQVREAAGKGPFAQLARHGPIPLGSCVATGPGQMLGANYILHVALQKAWAKPSLQVLEMATESAFSMARKLSIRSLAMPLLSSQEIAPQQAFDLIIQAAQRSSGDLHHLALALIDDAQWQAIEGLVEPAREILAAKL